MARRPLLTDEERRLFFGIPDDPDGLARQYTFTRSDQDLVAARRGAAQQAKYLTPVQADQFTRVGNTQTTRLNLQQNLKPAELLLAHRHHRHGATPRTPKPEGVSPQLCTGVSSLYCVYTGMSHNIYYGKLCRRLRMKTRMQPAS